MIFFIIGLFAVGVAVFLMLSERRGMYFRLVTQYYYTPRIGEQMRIIKTGYDEKGQIAILEGIGLDKTYALPCIYLPQKSAAGAETIFVYRQKFPTTQQIYRYGSMETELLAVGREMDDSVTVVKGAKRISSDSEWRTVNLLIHTFKLLLWCGLILCAIIFCVFQMTGSTASAVMMAVFGVFALVIKLLFKAEQDGPELRIYSDVAPRQNKTYGDAFENAAKRMGLADNERRAFMREKERREIFEKMNPKFNEFYAALKASVNNPPVPLAQNNVLATAAKNEMERVCFAITAHPQTKAEAVLAKREAAIKISPENMTPEEAELKGEEIFLEEVDEDQVKKLRKEAIARGVKTIVLEDCGYEPDEADGQPTPVSRDAAVSESSSHAPGNRGACNPPSKEDLSDVLKGNKVICTTCGCICIAPNTSNWAKMKCAECGATIRRG